LHDTAALGLTLPLLLRIALRATALAGLWGSPISGASMNPARTFGPDLASTTFTSYWVYIAGPIAGAVIAVGIAFVLRGRGGGKSGAAAAQGDLFTEGYEPGKS
jgi:aquaporin Z